MRPSSLPSRRHSASAPKEEKFRKIRLTNAKIKQVIGDVPAAMAALREMGWVEQEVDGEPFMVLPANVVIKFDEVRTIDAAQVDVKRETEKNMRRAISSKSSTINPEKEKLRTALANAKKERAAQGPVTKGSQANSLNFGSQVMTAKEAGINCGGGG